MKVLVSTKGTKLERNVLDSINKYSAKLNRFLPHFNPDLLTLNLFVRKNDDKFHVHRKYRHTGKDYLKGKSQLAHFEGSIRLIAPKKVLYTNFKGVTVYESVHTGIKNLIKEINKYKQLHFKSQSQYPHHETIRRIDVR